VLKEKPVGNLLRIEFVLSIYFTLIVAVALFRPPCINLITAFLVFAGGLIGGMHFPLSIAALKKQRAGFVYGIDLIGSSIGALVTAMILIPILGIVFTLVVFCLMNCLVGIGLATIKSGSIC